MKDSKAYTINKKKKTIIIDDKVQASPAEMNDIQLYVMGGYTIRHKSVKRAKKAKERAESNNLTKSQILEALKNDKEATAKFNSLLKDKGFFKAKSWYMKDYNK